MGESARSWAFGWSQVSIQRVELPVAVVGGGGIPGDRRGAGFADERVVDGLAEEARPVVGVIGGEPGGVGPGGEIGEGGRFGVVRGDEGERGLVGGEGAGPAGGVHVFLGDLAVGEEDDVAVVIEGGIKDGEGAVGFGGTLGTASGIGIGGDVAEGVGEFLLNRLLLAVGQGADETAAEGDGGDAIGVAQGFQRVGNASGDELELAVGAGGDGGFAHGTAGVEDEDYVEGRAFGGCGGQGGEVVEGREEVAAGAEGVLASGDEEAAAGVADKVIEEGDGVGAEGGGGDVVEDDELFFGELGEGGGGRRRG